MSEKISDLQKKEEKEEKEEKDQYKENEYIDESVNISKIDDSNNIDDSKKLSEIDDIVSPITSTKKLLAKYYSNSLEVSGEEFLKIKEFVDKIFEELSRQINFNEIQEHLALDVDIKNPAPESFVEKLSQVAEFRSYFIDKSKQLEGFLKTYDKYIDLLRVYLLIMSNKKKTDAELETTIKLKEYFLKRQIYDGILNKLNSREKVFENKYAALSRILTFWELDLNGASSHTRFKNR